MAGPDGAPGLVVVRPATAADADLLLRWRNDPAVRARSRSSAPIDRASHDAGLRRSLADPDRHILIVHAADGLAVGTTRYDVRTAGGSPGSRARWEISIAIAQEVRGRGFGSAALRASDAWLLAAEPGTTEIVAFVRPSNTGSRRLFEHHGYRAVPSPEPDMDCRVRRWEGR